MKGDTNILNIPRVNTSNNTRAPPADVLADAVVTTRFVREARADSYLRPQVCHIEQSITILIIFLNQLLYMQSTRRNRNERREGVTHQRHHGLIRDHGLQTVVRLLAAARSADPA